RPRPAAAAPRPFPRRSPPRRHTAPNSWRWTEAMLEALTEAGLTGQQRVIAQRCLVAYITGALQAQYLGPWPGQAPPRSRPCHPTGTRYSPRPRNTPATCHQSRNSGKGSTLSCGALACQLGAEARGGFGHRGQLAVGGLTGEVLHPAVRGEHKTLGPDVGQRLPGPLGHLTRGLHGVVVQVEHAEDNRLALQGFEHGA